MPTLCAIAALLLSADSSPEESLPRDLSLPEAEQIFLTRGLDLLIAEANATGAEGDLSAAGAHPNPGLNLTFLYGPETSHDLIAGTLHAPSGPENATLGFQVSLTDNAAIEDALSGKHSLRIQAAAKALASARLSIDDVRRLELSQLRQAYIAGVLAKLNVDAAKDSLETYDKQLKLNQVKFDKGAIARLDLSRILQAQLEALQALDSARAGYAEALATLVVLLGVRDGLPQITLTTDIDYQRIQLLDGATVGGLFEGAAKSRTDVQIATVNFQQTEVVVRQAKRAILPDIALQLGYGEQCNSLTCSSAPTFNIGLEGNLPVFYQQQGEIKRAESNALSARRALSKTRAQALSDVSQGFAGYVGARRLVERMEGQLLAQAKLSRDLAQLMYQKGAASLIDFMDAQRAYVASLLEYHQDLASYWTSVYQLEQATGMKLRP
jgi:cobalt-zinc-cadmium efflux system outer membrane protein